MQFYLALFFFGGLLFFRGAQLQKRLRQVVDTARSKLSSAPQGLVEVEGFALPLVQESGSAPASTSTFSLAPQAQLTSSSGTPVVYRRIEVQRFRLTRGFFLPRIKKWSCVHLQIDTSPFLILDPTGLADVFPENSDFEIDNTRTHYCSITFGARWQALLASLPHKISSELGLFPMSYRIVEQCITVGSPLYVRGEFRTVEPRTMRSSGIVGFRDHVMPKSRARGESDKPLETKKWSALIPMKTLSNAEKRNLYSGIASAALFSQRMKGVDEEAMNVYGEFRGSTNHNLMIADLHERELTEKMRFWRNVNVVCGVMLLALGLNFLGQTGERKQKIIRQRTVAHLHKKCYAGSIDSCDDLIRNSGKWELSETYVSGYKNKACSLGRKDLCVRVPTSAR